MMFRLFAVRSLDIAFDAFCLVRAVFAIVAAVVWRLISLPAGPRSRRPRGALLLAAVIIFAIVAAFCAVNAQGSVIVDVTQDQQKPVCSLTGCTIQRIRARDIGVVVGQLDDGTWVALGHARKFTLGAASIDLGNGDGAVRAQVIACNPRLDLSLLEFQHNGWLPCRPLKSDPQACAWIISKLGKMPVAPAREKDVKSGQLASAEPAPEPPATFVPPDKAPASAGPVEDIPPPRASSPAPQSPATAAPRPAEPARPAAPTNVDWSEVLKKAGVMGEDELKKMLAEHGQQLRNDYAQAVAAQRKAGATGLTGAKQAAVGVLKAQAPSILKEALKDAMPVVVAAVKSALPSLWAVLGIGALGATGPVGIGVAGMGLLIRSLKKLHRKNHNELLTRIGKPPPQTGPTAAQPAPNGGSPANLPPPPKAPPAVASAPETAPAQSTSSAPQQAPATTGAASPPAHVSDPQIVQVPVADPKGDALEQATTAILKRNPGISLLEAQPAIAQLAQTILDIRKPFTVQPASTGAIS